MAERRVGRPPREGRRYDNGRVAADGGDHRGHNVWHRIKDDGLRLGLDQRLGTELGRLGLIGELSDTQVEAGFLVARIYGAFERYKGQRRSTASPSYERSFGDPHAGEDGLSPEELAEHETRIRRAVKRMEKLQDEIAKLPDAHIVRARTILEELCVNDRHVDQWHLPSVRAMLDRIAGRFNIAGPEKIARSVAITASRPMRRANAEAIANARKRHVEKDAWLECQASLMPDALPEQLEDGWRKFQEARAYHRAKVDRDRFNKGKRARR